MKRQILESLLIGLFAFLTSIAPVAGDEYGQWTRIATFGYSNLALDPYNSATLYVTVTENKQYVIYKSIDDGESWNNVVNSTLPVKQNIDPLNPITLYTTNKYGTIFESMDGGAIWYDIKTGLIGDPAGTVVGRGIGLPPYQVFPPPGASSSHTINSYIGVPVIAPSNPAIRYTLVTFIARDYPIPQIYLYKSQDGGDNWFQVSFKYDKCSLSSSAVFYDMLVDPSNSDIIYRIFERPFKVCIYRSTNGGSTFSNIFQNVYRMNTFDFTIDPSHSNILYVVIHRQIDPVLTYNLGEVYKSIDGGVTWNTSSAGLPISYTQGLSRLGMDPSNPSILYVIINGEVFKSTNSGDNWNAISGTGLPVEARIQSIDINPSNPHTLYVGTDVGLYTFTYTTSTDQTIRFGAASSVIVGGIGTVSATGGGSGNPVTFTSTTTGICSIDGNLVTGITPGRCIIAADQVGNANYDAAPQAKQTVSIGKGNQTISFGAAPTLNFGGTGTASATGGGSGNPVRFTSTTAGVCTVSGSMVTGITVGTCTIAADQAGNANFNAAPQALLSFNVSPAHQAISFGAASFVTVGGTGTVSATGGVTGNPVRFASTTLGICSIDGNVVTGITAGTCIIAADQAGNANFNAAPQALLSFNVSPAHQAISFGAASFVTVGGTGTVSATGGVTGNPVRFASTTLGICSIDGNVVTGITAGTCIIAADQAGNTNFNAAPQALLSFNVSPANLPTASTECLFNWAERQYPNLLAPSGSITATSGVYAYRHYSASNAYLGISSTDLHVYFQGSDGILQDIGPLSEWLPKAACNPVARPPFRCLSAWAELNYPHLFSPPGVSESAWFPYTYQYYSTTNSYLGVSSVNDHVYYQGSVGHLQDLGEANLWREKAGCQ